MPQIIKNKPKKVKKSTPKKKKTLVAAPTKTSAPLFPSLLPAKTSSAKKTASAHSKVKHSPAEYYNCLLTYANQN
jgi:hypothetical protein